MSLMRLRGRLPLLGFLLLAVIFLALLGFACACLSDQPINALERAAAALSTLPGLVEVWSFVTAALIAPALFVLARQVLPAALSPPALQRFLF